MIEAIKVGSEFLVNTQTAGRQADHNITDLEGGGFVITWWDDGRLQFGSDLGVKAQIFAADGAKVGSEFVVNTTTDSVQDYPSITGLIGGGFVVTWQDYSGTSGDSSETAVIGQLYGATGARIGGEFRVNTETLYSQRTPEVTSLEGGGFVVTWFGYVGTVGTYKAQVFDTAGAKVGGEFVINATPANTGNNEITSLAGGGFVVTWEDLSGTLGDSSDLSLKAQVFDAGGTKLGSEFLVNTATTGVQGSPSIAGLEAGGFVVTWADYGSSVDDSSPPSIKAQLFDAGGAKVGSEFLVNTQTASRQFSPSVTSLTDGGFVVTWSDFSGTLGDTSGASIKAQVYDADGVRVGGEFLVNTQTAGGQIYSAITGLADGGFAVAWSDISGTLGDTDSGGIKAQVFKLDEPPAPVLTITSNGGGDAATVAIRENGTAVTTVTASNAGASPLFEIMGGADAAFFQINAATGALTFKAAPDFEAPADAGANNGYAVTIKVSSGAQSDMQVLTVMVTDQDIETAPLAITSNGGGDTAAFGLPENGKAVTFVAVSGGSAATRYAITGGADAALFSISSTTGALRFIAAPNFEARGDAGRDNVYDVIVQAAEGSLTDSQAIAVTVTNVVNEVLVGTSRADILIGASGNDTIKGGAGDDRLSGSSGADQLFGGTGDDVLSGGTGADRLLGGEGRNTLFGGEGADRFRFNVLETGGNRDTINDFVHNVDRIEIARSAFAAFAGDKGSALAPDAFLAGTKALTADQHLIYNQTTGGLYYDADGRGGGAQVLIALLSSKPLLDAGDFLLV